MSIGGYVMMAMSLDGFVAREDHGLDWLMKQPTEGEDHGYFAFMDSIDVIVMGSGSYRTVLGFEAWPYEKPVIVLSKNLSTSDIPEALKAKVEVSDLEPEALMARLAAEGVTNVYVDGGAVVQSFLRLGLIKSMKITFVPILIGTGIRLFSDLPADIDLKLVKATEHPSGLVDLDYLLN